jgi:hypothetical protein
MAASRFALAVRAKLNWEKYTCLVTVSNSLRDVRPCSN